MLDAVACSAVTTGLGGILAIGFRVRSHRGTQFRKWANARLPEYLVKGFAMDDDDQAIESPRTKSPQLGQFVVLDLLRG